MRFALVGLVLVWDVAAQQGARELPLNRFAEARTATAGEFYWMPAAIGDDYFDGTSPAARVERHMKAARRLGARYLRCGFSWNGIEKEQGKYDWSFWDALVAAGERHGIGIIPYMAYTPQWAAREAKEFWKQPPRDTKWYGELMFQAARRYRGRIRSWEIWNEPDNKDYWTGSAKEFAELVRVAARRIREGDPGAVLVLGGMANGPSAFFRELMTEDRIDRTVDVIAAHAYPESWLDERGETIFDEWIPAMRKMIDDGGSGADLWLNEMGYADYRLNATAASVYGTRVFYRYEHTAEYQASMLFKMFTMTLGTGAVSLGGWYRIDDFPHSETRMGTDFVNFHLGVVDTQGREKPAFRAMRYFDRLFRRSSAAADVRVTRPAGSQAVVKVFRTADGRAVVAGWLRSSHADEVADRSGMAEDRRAETVAVELPCRYGGGLKERDAQGRKARGARVREGTLENVRLTGDAVYVAEMRCK